MGFISLPALCLALALSASAAAAQEVGVVTAVDGAWFRSAPGTRALGPGDRVARSDTLAIRPGFTARKYLAVVLRNGRYVRFSCPARGPCGRAFVPADSLRERTGVPRVLAALVDGVAGLFSRGHPAYAEGFVRGAPFAGEAVVRLRDGAVDLAPVLRGARPGRYAVAFRPLAGSPAAALLPPDTVAWDDGPALPVAACGVVPGLYEVEVRAVGGPDDLSARAWVRVAAESFAKDEAAFRAVQAVVAEWAGADEQEKRAFLRAALDFLARGGVESPPPADPP